jgi:RNA polymerase sigma-70 factor (ECF subfamily)
VSSPTTSESSPIANRSRWFNEQVHPHDSHLKAYLKGSFPAVRDVDDIVQESYLRVWRRHAARPIESVKGFLFQVARRLAVDTLRRSRTAATDQLGDLIDSRVLDERPDAAVAASEQEMHDLLADALLALPGRCREIVMLRKIKGIPQREVAAQLGLSERTVENHCRIGVKRCEDFLRARGVCHRYRDEP